jgi:hypothetical protein
MYAHTIRAELELNVASTANSADAIGQDTASQIQAVNAHASRAFVRRYLDPLGYYIILHTIYKCSW